MINQTKLEIYPVITPTRLPLKSYNFYVIKNANQLFLIDAGVDTAECWQELNAVLRGNGFVLSDIEFIVLTHHHADHIGLVNRIRARHPVPVYAHEKSLLRLQRNPVFLQKRIGFFDELYRIHGSRVIGERQVNKLKESFIKNKAKAISGKVYPDLGIGHPLICVTAL